MLRHYWKPVTKQHGRWQTSSGRWARTFETPRRSRQQQGAGSRETTSPDESVHPAATVPAHPMALGRALLAFGLSHAGNDDPARDAAVHHTDGDRTGQVPTG